MAPLDTALNLLTIVGCRHRIMADRQIKRATPESAALQPTSYRSQRRRRWVLVV